MATNSSLFQSGKAIGKVGSGQNTASNKSLLFKSGEAVGKVSDYHESQEDINHSVLKSSPISERAFLPSANKLKEHLATEKLKTTIPSKTYDATYVPRNANPLYASSNVANKPMLDYDANAGGTEIDNLQSIYDIVEKRNAAYLRAKNKLQHNKWSKTRIEQVALLDETVTMYDEQLKSLGYSGTTDYNALQELRKQLTEKKQFHNQSKVLQKGVNLTETAITSKDFNKNGKVNSDFSNDEKYKYINDIGGYRDIALNNYYKQISTQATEQNGVAHVPKPTVLENNYSFMTDEEVKIYNYYYATQGAEKANEYLEVIQRYLNERASGDIVDLVGDSNIAKVAYGGYAGLKQFGAGVKNILNEDQEYYAPSAQQFANEKIRETVDGAWGVAYDVTNAVGNMLPSVLTSTVVGFINPAAGAAVGSAMIGASSAGNAYSEMINLGYDKSQARTYAGLVGGSEALLQYLLGGIGKLGGKVTGKTIAKIVSGIDKGFAKFAIRWGVSAVAEGIEESSQSLLEPLFENIAAGYDVNTWENVDWSEVIYSGLLGMLTGGLFELVPSATETYRESTEAKSFYGDTKENIQALIDEGKAMPQDSRANRLAQKYQQQFDKNGDLSGTKLNNLVEANEQAMLSADKTKIKTAIEERLITLGENTDKGAVANVIVKEISGEVLSADERAILDNSTYGNRVLNEMTPSNVQSGEYTSDWVKDINTDRINSETYSLQDNQSGDIINQGGDVNVNKRTAEPSVEEIRRKHFKGEDSKQSQRSKPETAEAFAKRTGETGAKGSTEKRTLLTTGKSSIAYNPSTTDSSLKRFVEKLKSIGIEAYCCTGPMETNSNGVTTIHYDAFTSSKGRVFFNDSNNFSNKQKADHELVHLSLRELDESYLDYEDIIISNLLYESNYYIAFCLELNEREYNNQYKISLNDYIEDAAVFNSEIAAYVYQKVLNERAFADEFFSNMFKNWEEIVNAVYTFNSKMKVDTNELNEADTEVPANFMPENEDTPSSESGEYGLSEPSDQEIHREPTAEEYNEAMFGKMKNAKQRHILDVAGKLDSGMKVVFVNENAEVLSGQKGVYMRDSNTMYLSESNSAVESYYQLFKHEFIHRLESKGAYQGFKNYLFRNSSSFERYARAQLGKDFKGNREEALQALAQKYIDTVQKGKFSQDYKNSFTEEDAQREMVADFISEVLFKGNRKDVAQHLSESNLDAIFNIEDMLTEFESLTETDRNWFQRIIDTIKDFIASLKGVNQNKRLVEDLEYIEKRLGRVLDSKDTKKAASRAVNKQFYINDDFYNQLNKWDRETTGFSFVLGGTSEALKSAGIPDKQIRWDATKIKTLLNKHSGMTIEIIKQIPELLENPVLVIDSKQDVNSRIIMGDLYDEHNKIVTVVLLLSPTSKKGNVLDLIKVSSAEGRGHIQSLLKKEDGSPVTIRYKDEKRIRDWLNVNRLQLPLHSPNTDSNDIIDEKTPIVKDIISNENDNYSESPQKTKGQFSLGSPAQQMRDNLKRYESGEITREEYLEKTDELWGEANETYGMIPQGENAKAPIATPQAVDEDKPTERFTRTIIETGKLTDEMLGGMEEKVLLGDFSYEMISDEKATQKADAAIKNGTAEDIWENVIHGKRTNKNQIAIGERLLKDAIESGNTKRVLELSSELADIFTRAGQVVQAARLLKKMTGAGRLVSAQRTVKTLNRDLRQKYGEDFPTIKISPEAAKRLAEAKTKDGIEHAYEEVMYEVAEQMPVTFMDKWNAWRYFAMLCNPKTHIRNVVGNAIFVPAVRIRYFLAAVGEQAVSREDKTKSVIVKKEFRDFAKRDVKNQEVINLLKGNKYNDKKGIREKQRIFKNNTLEFLTRFNSNALESEDMLFKNKHYIHALAGFLQARNVNIETVSQEILDEARIYAVEEAKKATFNDESALANWIQNFGNKNIATSVAVEGVLPFKRTPINIVKRGVEYSPIGLTKTLTKGLYDVKKGKITLTEFIDGLASGFTGTGIMLVGMFLANLGFISGGEDEDEKSQFEKLLGKQEYAVEVLGKSYTVDWAAPANIPFFIGVEIVNTVNEEEEFSLSKLGNIVWNSLEPITNLSMLSGMQGVIESARYADSAQTLSAIATDAMTSYAMQVVPSLSGAVARTIDPTQRSWYTDKNDKWLDSTAQTVKNNIQSKVPGLSYTQIPKIDMWGREVSRGGTAERVLENFVSPGYYSELEITETSEELKRIFNKTDIDVFPNVAAKSFELDGKTKHLTAAEYVTYAKAKGTYSYDYIKEFLEASSYERLTDEEKADVIGGLYEYANAKAKATVSNYDLMKRYKTVTQWERNGRSAVDYYIYKAISK